MPDEKTIAEAARLAAKAASPSADRRGSVEYKREMTRVLAGRALPRRRSSGREEMTWKHKISVTVNGAVREAEVESRLLLVHFIRENLRLTGTHVGCDTSHCGVCTVHLDGEPVKSCTVLAVQADGRSVNTVEGLEQGGKLHPMQEAFTEKHALQCGFCTPGHADDHQRAARAQQEPERAGDPPGDLRQPVPLHRVSQHREGGAARRRENGGGMS